MAYVSKEQKKDIAHLLKQKFGTNAKKRGFKYSLKVANSSKIIMTISSGSIDFIGNWKESSGREPSSCGLSIVHLHDKSFSGKVRKIIKDALECLNLDNYNNSDIMTDYFDVGHYIELNIGSWDKPYKLTV